MGPIGEYIKTCLICEHEFPIPNYGDGMCPKCDQEYEYNEGHSISLSKHQIEELQTLIGIR